jgi:hypothetical protein
MPHYVLVIVDVCALVIGMDPQKSLENPLITEEPTWKIKCRYPTSTWSKEQKMWILFQTVVGCLIASAVNFGCTTLTFRGEDPPTLWEFPTPMAGTYAVTLGIQLYLNWFVSIILMTSEVASGNVPPIDPQQLAWWPSKSSKLRWWLGISELALCCEGKTPPSLGRRIFNHLHRASPWGIFAFFMTWPIFVLISWLCWGNDGYNSFPLPQILVASFGAFLGLVTTPLWAAVLLADMGDRRLT